MDSGIRQRSGLRLAALALVAGVAFSQVWADPPPWAPAHGWRKKNDPTYQGYTGRQWGTDYGVVAGACRVEAAGAVVGGVLGGAVGSQVGKGEGRAVAILVGTVIGAAVGAQMARGVADEDRACIGHTLELVGDNRPVGWVNQNTGISYVVTPLRGYKEGSLACREFTTRTSVGGRSGTSKGRACRSGEGVWRIQG